MAKMTYSTEDALAKLGITKEELAKLVSDGRLREFRDGAKFLYKADEVDTLAAADAAADDEIGLAPADSAEDIQLSPSDTGSQMGLAPEDTGTGLGLGIDDTVGDLGLAALDTGGPLDTGSSIGLVPGDSADHINLSPTDTGSQMGLTSTDSADQISLEDTSRSLAPEKDDTVLTSGSAIALSDSTGEIPTADELAEGGDEIDLDNGASGSGLLDLSREADDTSLGAELLEEIYPGADEAAVETQIPTQFQVDSATTTGSGAVGIGLEAGRGGEVMRMAPQYVDSGSGAFGAMMVLPLIVLAYLACVTTAALTELRPNLFEYVTPYIWYVIGGAGAVSLAVAGVGLFIANQAGQGARPKKPKGPKGKKQK